MTMRRNSSVPSAHRSTPGVDFILEIFQEKIPYIGEDSYLFWTNACNGIVGVFDGCGGSGAKKYEKFQSHSGAYMASRAVSGAVWDWFRQGNKGAAPDAAQLKSVITRCLRVCRDAGGGSSAFKGSLAKDFPTTASVILYAAEGNSVQASCLWAGDSRCYLLDEHGLKQLSEDDLNDLDAMENISADGVLTNVISLSRDFKIHTRTIEVTGPCILFTATDGCFGYLSTPMEFEYLLTGTLVRSGSVDEWENRICSILRKTAGDDFTLCGVSIGYGSFSALTGAFQGRAEEIYRRYIHGITEKSRDEKVLMWQSYKPEYEGMLKEE